MIAKAKTTSYAGKFGEAGDAAERQMAYYLDRDFGASKNVQLFHDLRLEHNGHAAQIDHLVMHRYGMVIVESKSVSGRVQINEHGEWSRLWGGRKQGMASPIQQAKLQRDLLIDLLEAHAEQLLDKMLAGLLQTRFGGCPFMVLVAISDHGIIERKGTNPPEVMKADQICDRIYQEIVRHKKSRLTLGFKDPDYGIYRINPNETGRIVSFLLARHAPLKAESSAPVDGPPPAPEPRAPNEAPARPRTTPRTRTPKPAAPQPPAPPAVLPPTVNPVARPSNGKPATPALACKHCTSRNIYATHGRFGYYLKCRDCEGNTPIDYACTACGKKGRIGKSSDNFDRVCLDCGHEERVWVNSPEAE